MQISLNAPCSIIFRIKELKLRDFSIRNYFVLIIQYKSLMLLCWKTYFEEHLKSKCFDIVLTSFVLELIEQY